MHKNHVEAEKKAKDAAESRGQATAYGLIGGIGTAGWLFIETCLSNTLADTFFEIAKESKASQKTWKKIGFATAIVSAGAVGLAIYKHRHAHKLEDEKQNLLEAPSWIKSIEVDKLNKIER